MKYRVEDIFSSRGRVKVLKTIIDYGELNITQIIKLTGLNHRTVVKHIEYLKDADIIEETDLGRSKIYRPKWVNPKVRYLEELIRDIEG